MKILGIETSCDDTGIAIIEWRAKKQPSFAVLANVLSSQVKLHQKYGGVYPSLAKREHTANLPIVLQKALKQAKLSPKDPGISAVAVTVGPGLDPCLWTGIAMAKEIAAQWNLPIIPVNHMEGHLLISLFSQGKTLKLPPKNSFPLIALIVSGGHTQLILSKGPGIYEILGETRDDAAGECFDKTARILGLEYPGGPAIAREAQRLSEEILLSRKQYSEQHGIRLPRPMIRTKDYDFSFSGLKTAVLYDWQSRPKRVRQSQQYITVMAQKIQQAIVDVLVAKTSRALQQYRAQSLVLGGGVAANRLLRQQLKKELATHAKKPAFFAAPPELCTDNGLMIALAGYAHRNEKAKNNAAIAAKPHLKIE